MLGLYDSFQIKVMMTEQNQDNAAFLPGVFPTNCAAYCKVYSTKAQQSNNLLYCNWAIVCEYRVWTHIPIFCAALRRMARLQSLKHHHWPLSMVHTKHWHALSRKPAGFGGTSHTGGRFATSLLQLFPFPLPLATLQPHPPQLHFFKTASFQMATSKISKSICYESEVMPGFLIPRKWA